jgi:hypothetical protein
LSLAGHKVFTFERTAPRDFVAIYNYGDRRRADNVLRNPLNEYLFVHGSQYTGSAKNTCKDVPIFDEKILSAIRQQIQNSKENDILERQMQEWVILNLPLVGKDLGIKNLELYTDDKGHPGFEYRIDDGGRRIDIVAVDYDKTINIIELKRGEAPDRTIGQIMHYVGWAKEKFIGRKVRGILIAKKFSDRFLRTVQNMPDLTTWIYPASA